MGTRQAALTEGLAGYQELWSRARPDWQPLGTPDMRTAAYVIALGRSRKAATQRGVWP